MPELCRFLGIVVVMYYNDHDPPHFHARYRSCEIVVRISDGRVTGRFPRRALNLVFAWYTLRRDELKRNWARARQHRPLRRMAPLE